MIIRPSNPCDIDDIKVFYRQCGYGGSLNEEDLIFIATMKAEIVGAVRLCPTPGLFVLRGMQILAPFQRQGIGTQLLQRCTEQLVGCICYCIPWQHLQSFYQQTGFQKVSSTEVPLFLRERFDNYISRGLDVILMCRLPTSSQVGAAGE